MVVNNSMGGGIMIRVGPVEILHRSADGVGESLRWLAEEQALYWVDITGRRINRLEPASGCVDHWQLGVFPTAIVPRSRGGAIIPLDNRVAEFVFPGSLRTICVPEPDEPAHRLNEAAADPAGRFWV